MVYVMHDFLLAYSSDAFFVEDEPSRSSGSAEEQFLLTKANSYLTNSEWLGALTNEYMPQLLAILPLCINKTLDMAQRCLSAPMELGYTQLFWQHVGTLNMLKIYLDQQTPPTDWEPSPLTALMPQLEWEELSAHMEIPIVDDFKAAALHMFQHPPIAEDSPYATLGAPARKICLTSEWRSTFWTNAMAAHSDWTPAHIATDPRWDPRFVHRHTWQEGEPLDNSQNWVYLPNEKSWEYPEYALWALRNFMDLAATSPDPLVHRQAGFCAALCVFFESSINRNRPISHCNLNVSVSAFGLEILLLQECLYVPVLAHHALEAMILSAFLVDATPALDLSTPEALQQRDTLLTARTGHLKPHTHLQDANCDVPI